MSASPYMKQLRILSGTHAGASLDLMPGRYSLSGAHDADISISDWRFAALVMDVQAEGPVTLHWGEAPQKHLDLHDYQPVEFQDVALCVGSAYESWPDATALFAVQKSVGDAIARGGVFAVWRAVRRTPWITHWRLSLGGLIMFALISSGWLMSTGTNAQRPAPVTAAQQRPLLQRALDEVAPHRLHVSANDEVLTVRGMVDDPAQAARVANAIEHLPPHLRLKEQITVATEVAQAIANSVGINDAKVQYQGQGIFEFSAAVEHPDKVRAAVARVAADLGPFVQRIDTRLESHEAKKTPLPASRSVWSTQDGVNIVEGMDGSKYIVLSNNGRDTNGPDQTDHDLPGQNADKRLPSQPGDAP